jgi:hypothetical protein
MNIRYDRFHTVSGYVMAKSNRISLKALVELYYSIINQNKSFLLLANGTRIELNPAPVYGYLAVVNGSEYIRSQTINRPAIYNYKFIPFAVKYLTRDSLRSLLENGYMYDLYMQICTVVPNTVIYNTVYRTLGIGTVLSIIKDSQSGAWWDGRYAIAASA